MIERNEPSPRDLASDYYEFERYVTFERFQTYYFQIRELYRKKPRSVLEIGIGSGFVKRSISGTGVSVTTCDINSNLEPDVVGSVTELSELFPNDEFDLVLCSRVLHHIDFADVPVSIEHIMRVSKKYAILVVAVDNFRIYLSGRATGVPGRYLSLPLPRIAKKILLRLAKRNLDTYYSNWRIGSSELTKAERFEEILAQRCKIIDSYDIPTDHGHRLYVLEKFAQSR